MNLDELKSKLSNRWDIDYIDDVIMLVDRNEKGYFSIDISLLPICGDLYFQHIFDIIELLDKGVVPSDRVFSDVLSELSDKTPFIWEISQSEDNIIEVSLINNDISLLNGYIHIDLINTNITDSYSDMMKCVTDLL